MQEKNTSTKHDKADVYHLAGNSPAARGQVDVPDSRKVSRESLINKLNFINFQDGTVQINFQHREHKRIISVKAAPAPCLDENLLCHWIDSPPIGATFPYYSFHSMVVADEQKHLLVNPQIVELTPDRFRCILPEISQEFVRRRAKRHKCAEISAQIIQHGTIFHGQLIDFNAFGFRVVIKVKPPQTFQWISPDTTATIVLNKDGHTLLTTECRIIRQDGPRDIKTFILEPVAHSQQRFKKRDHRSERLELKPQPNVTFIHPLTKQKINLNVENISATGFAIEEAENNSVLVPGLLIPDLELSIGGSLNLTCLAQVIYRDINSDGTGSKRVKCGLAILDMNIVNHDQLMALLHQADDQHSYFCNQIDIDQLWNFFFETGFIYPQKYHLIQNKKAEFKKTYERLYSENPSIARYFTYQQHGDILGHMGMLRLYSNSWLVHHHVADRTQSKKAGISVLRQISRVVNDSHAIYSAHMDYCVCYYRPENRFPKRVFGGIADHYNDPRHCSIDTFAYLVYRKEFDSQWKDASSWELTKTQTEDLHELSAYYDHVSGGLMIKALDLEPDIEGKDEIKTEYEKLGFKFDRLIFSLKREGILTAIFIVTVTDIGLNLADLTNSISVIITDPQHLPRETLFTAISMLASKYDHDDVPVMIFPHQYADEHKLPYEKNYNMWVLDSHHMDPYFEFCETFFKRI